MTPGDLLRGMRASLYVRLSKAADGRNLSKQGMIDDLRSLCTSRGFIEVSLWVDDGKSGAIRDRPAFRAWLQDAIDGRADVLVAWHVDRLSREGINVAALILDVVEGKDPQTGQVVRQPVRLIGYDDRLDSADGEAFRLNFLIKAEQARSELNRMKSRSQARVKRMRKEKRSTGGLIPYGYQKMIRGDMELEHDPVSAPIVRDITAKVIAGRSIASVAKELNDKGVLSPRDHAALRDTGKPRADKETGEPFPPQKWTDMTIRRMLTNPVMLGRLTDSRRIVRDNEGRPVMRGKPLISEEEWSKLQDAINGTKKPKYRKSDQAMLSGEVFCPMCGSILHVHLMVKPDRDQEYRYYRCSGRTRKGNGCTAGAPRAERLESLVADMLLDALGDQDIMQRVYMPADDSAKQLADIETRLKELREDRKAGLYSGEQGSAEYREMYLPLERLREELTTRPKRGERWEYVSTGETYRERWATADIVGRRAIFRESGIRLEAMRATATTTIGRFERPGEAAICLSSAQDDVQAFMFLPPGLASRVTGDPARVIEFREYPLLTAPEAKPVSVMV